MRYIRDVEYRIFQMHFLFLVLSMQVNMRFWCVISIFVPNGIGIITMTRILQTFLLNGISCYFLVLCLCGSSVMLHVEAPKKLLVLTTLFIAIAYHVLNLVLLSLFIVQFACN